MSVTIIYDTNLPCSEEGFLDTPTEGAHCVVTVTHYILTKFFISVWFLVLINEKKLISCYYNFIWTTVYTTYFRDLDNPSLHMNCTIRFFYFVSFLNFRFTWRRKQCAFQMLRCIFYMLRRCKYFKIVSVTPLPKNCVVQYNLIWTHTVCRNVFYL